jgi:hypothetical protein
MKRDMFFLKSTTDDKRIKVVYRISFICVNHFFNEINFRLPVPVIPVNQ